MNQSKKLCINQSGFTTDFTICTLVTNLPEYEEMVESFNKAGFTEENSEFFYIDNSNGNAHDGYSGLNKFLNTATGTYIIICHQDILLNFDTVNVLKQRIAELDALDPDWAILGNAGFAGFTEKFYRISDPWGSNTHLGTLPAKVKSLDENFLVIKNEANLALSHNLKGFHLYATDLCTIASILGWNAYVIDFHLYHKSAGNCSESFFNSKMEFINKYSKLIKPFAIRTTCTMMLITGCSFFNRVINKKLFYSIKKRLESLRR
jgi:hypothetical protein